MHRNIRIVPALFLSLLLSVPPSDGFGLGLHSCQRCGVHNFRQKYSSSLGKRIQSNAKGRQRFRMASKSYREIASTTISDPEINSCAKEVPSSHHHDNNWRAIPAQAVDYQPFIDFRMEWSDAQFKASLSLYESLMSCTDSYVAPGIQEALNSLDHAYRLYGPESVICSFNGGKDAVVIFHLLRAAHAKYYNSTITSVKFRPRVIYFEHEDEFPQVLDFLQNSVTRYDLDMMAFAKGVGFGDGLKILVEHNYLNVGSSNTTTLEDCRRPFPMAFVLGTRQADPNAGGQDVFAPSSHYMPPFMRVNPILQWTYGHVWHFLRLFQLPYCSLYDDGYTSLGTTKDTLPCPALQVITSSEDDDDTSKFPKFWPAYMLKDWDQERAGRIRKEKKAAQVATTATGKRMTTSTATTTAPESCMSTVSDLRRSDPSPRVDVDTTELEETGTARANVESCDNYTVAETETIVSIDSSQEDYDYADDSRQKGQPALLQQAPKTVGILIIGDEILKGMTLDINTNAAAKALRKENVLLRRVVVCSDDQDEIVKDIRRMMQEDNVDVIITSGGVGPTHDDVTIKSVAAALNRDLVLNKEMVDLLVAKMNNTTTGSNSEEIAKSNGSHSMDGRVSDGDSYKGRHVHQQPQLTEAQLKMATLPSNAKLRYLSEKGKLDWPVLQCRNIFILPGVPEFFAGKIDDIATYLSSSQFERSVAYKIVLSVDEASIVDTLNEVVSKHPHVSFGSYPFVSHPEFKTVVTLEACYQQNSWTRGNEFAPTAVTGTGSFVVVSSSKEQRDCQVRLALDDLITQLPTGSILRVENDDLTTFT